MDPSLSAGEQTSEYRMETSDIPYWEVPISTNSKESDACTFLGLLMTNAWALSGVGYDNKKCMLLWDSAC
jgi:hypothetical protein